MLRILYNWIPIRKKHFANLNPEGNILLIQIRKKHFSNVNLKETFCLFRSRRNILINQIRKKHFSIQIQKKHFAKSDPEELQYFAYSDMGNKTIIFTLHTLVNLLKILKNVKMYKFPSQIQQKELKNN